MNKKKRGCKYRSPKWISFDELKPKRGQAVLTYERTELCDILNPGVVQDRYVACNWGVGDFANGWPRDFFPTHLIPLPKRPPVLTPTAGPETGPESATERTPR